MAVRGHVLTKLAYYNFKLMELFPNLHKRAVWFYDGPVSSSQAQTHHARSPPYTSQEFSFILRLAGYGQQQGESLDGNGMGPLSSGPSEPTPSGPATHLSTLLWWMQPWEPPTA